MGRKVDIVVLLDSYFRGFFPLLREIVVLLVVERVVGALELHD